MTAKTSHATRRWPLRPRLLVLLLMIAGVVGLGFTYHLKAKARFAEVRQLTTKLQVPTDARFIEESGEGDGLSAYGCVDTHCPSYSFTYVVPLAPGTEMDTVRAVLQKSGYTVMQDSEASCEKKVGWTPICYASNAAHGLLVNASIQFPTEQRRDWVPAADPPAGREWRQLIISVADY
jgi:hypothetical protein